MSSSRTSIIAKNSTYSVICHCLTMVLQFVVRTFFIKCLTIEYVGIQGLFSNLLLILSLADLGMVNAMNFSLYKPLADDNLDKVAQLMAFFRKIYKIIAIIVLLLGLGIMPFISYFITEKPSIPESIYLIFLFFVFNSAISYLFAYKQTLITADQKKYVISVYTLIVNVIIFTLQCLFLYITRSFYSFLILMIIGTIVTNLIIAKKCDNLYPTITCSDIRPIDSLEKKKIFSDIKALFLYRIGGVILNGTSNILISKFFGLVLVGLCSNVYFLVNAINNIILQALNSFLATLGNLNAVEDDVHKVNAFFKTSLFCFWLYGFICLGLFLFMNNFITIWIGSQYQLDNIILFSIIFVFYMDGVGFPLYAYRSTMGLFTLVRFAPLIASVINIALALFLKNIIGVAGIYIAIAITRFICINITDIYVVFKNGLHGYRPIKLFVYYIAFFGILLITYYLSLVISSIIIVENKTFMLLIKAIFYCIIYNFLFLIIFFKSSSFKSLYYNINTLFNK